MRTPAYGAVQPGTDLGVHARALRRVHDAVLGGASPPLAPRPLVARSWTRVMQLGLDPTRANARDPLGRAEVERRRRGSALSLVIDDVRAVLGSVADASRFITVVTDPDGVILWREGSARVLQQADSLGFSEGATWTEDHVGTNAIGTALAEAAPVQLFSAEHFEEGQIPWYCTAAPLHDPRTGELLGVVDVSGPALTLHPAIIALVETAAKLAEAQLWRHHQERLERLRRSAEHVLATTSGPLLLVDDHGWVAHHAGVAARDRIAVPDERRALAVPGLGLCLPERLSEGWLVRPSPGDASVTATLDTSADEAVLEVSSERRQLAYAALAAARRDPAAPARRRADRSERRRPQPRAVRRRGPPGHRPRRGEPAAAYGRRPRRDPALPHRRGRPVPHN